MATETDALAQVYARSLFELAQEAGGTDKVLEIADELSQVCEMSRADSSFREFLASPIVDVARRGESLRRIFADRITDLTLRFLLVLNKKGRLSHLEPITGAYDLHVHTAFGRIEVDVITPAPMAAEHLEPIKQRIQAALGREPILYQSTDPSMIGGIKLRIGDQLIDGSVANRLRRIRQNLLTSGSARVRDQFERFIEEGSEPA